MRSRCGFGSSSAWVRLDRGDARRAALELRELVPTAARVVGAAHKLAMRAVACHLTAQPGREDAAVSRLCEPVAAHPERLDARYELAALPHRQGSVRRGAPGMPAKVRCGRSSTGTAAESPPPRPQSTGTWPSPAGAA